MGRKGLKEQVVMLTAQEERRAEIKKLLHLYRVASFRAREIQTSKLSRKQQQLVLTEVFGVVPATYNNP